MDDLVHRIMNEYLTQNDEDLKHLIRDLSTHRDDDLLYNLLLNLPDSLPESIILYLLNQNMGYITIDKTVPILHLYECCGVRKIPLPLPASLQAYVKLNK